MDALSNYLGSLAVKIASDDPRRELHTPACPAMRGDACTCHKGTKEAGEGFDFRRAGMEVAEELPKIWRKKNQVQRMRDPGQEKQSAVAALLAGLEKRCADGMPTLPSSGVMQKVRPQKAMNPYDDVAARSNPSVTNYKRSSDDAFVAGFLRAYALPEEGHQKVAWTGPGQQVDTTMAETIMDVAHMGSRWPKGQQEGKIAWDRVIGLMAHATGDSDAAKKVFGGLAK